MTYFFIVNPNSGSGSGLKVWNQTKKMLNSLRLDYDVYFTDKTADARNKAYEVTHGRKEELAVIAVGGDGTVNEVLNGLDLSAPVIFGFIPSGSGNDLARSLGCGGLQKALQRLFVEPYLREMDYGVVSTPDGQVNRRFLVSCGVGFDAAVCHSLDESKPKVLMNRLGCGKLAYPAIGIEEFLRSSPVSGSVVIDCDRKVEFRSIFFVSFQNHPYEGGGYRFAPSAVWDDGKLDMTAVSTRNKLKLVPVLLNKKSGLHENGFIRFFPFSEVSMHLDSPLAMHADGENLGRQTDFTVRCIHGQLKVIT